MLLAGCLQPPRTDPRHSHVSSAWWAAQVCCVTIEEIKEPEEETGERKYYMLTKDGGQTVLQVTRQHLRAAPSEWLGKYWTRPIVAFTELRQHFWSAQPSSWITYHAGIIVEVEGDAHDDTLYVLVERVDDRLELMLGIGQKPRSLMLEFRATGAARKCDRCFMQPRQTVVPTVTCQRFFGWIGTTLSKGWKPYHILKANCQHIAEEVRNFLLDPDSPENAPEILVGDNGVLQAPWLRESGPPEKNELSGVTFRCGTIPHEGDTFRIRFQDRPMQYPRIDPPGPMPVEKETLTVLHPAGQVSSPTALQQHLQIEQHLQDQEQLWQRQEQHHTPPSSFTDDCTLQ